MLTSIITSLNSSSWGVDIILFWSTIPLNNVAYGLVNNQTGQIYAGELEVNPNNTDMMIVTYRFDEANQALAENTTYTFSVGLRDLGDLAGFEQYGCVDSEEITVGDLYYYGEFPSIFISDFNPFSDVPENKEMIAFAPEIGGYNANYYKLSIFTRWGELIYEKEENVSPGTEAFPYNYIRWDGKLRSCHIGIPCYPEILGSEGPNAEEGPCSDGSTPHPISLRISCNDSYWEENDGLNACYDRCGFPRFHSAAVYTYVLLLKNCTGEKIYSKDVTIYREEH